MTKEIQLTRGQVTVVDEEDYEYLTQWEWYAKPMNKYGGKFYASRSVYQGGCSKTIRMHREIASRMGIDISVEVDHKDRNSLNNTRVNLRAASETETSLNRSLRRDNKSGFKGVYYRKKCNKWVAQIRTQGELTSLGSFESPILAAIAYNNAARELHGEFAVLNVIPNPQPHE